MTTIAILQSNYIPWKGYFDVIAAVDHFVVYDCVQYTKNDWRNRNRIKTPKGSRWLTVPVHQNSLVQRIDETDIADPDILPKHWSIINQNYANAAAFDEMRERVHPLFDRGAPQRLRDLNVDLIRAFCDILGIQTPIRSASEFEIGDDRTGRLVEICQQLGADRYLSGPSARNYLDVDLFTESGIDVEWMDYSGYSKYAHPFPPFEHNVSIVDLVLCTGEEASKHLVRSRQRSSG